MDDDERLIRALKELAAIETQKRQKKSVTTSTIKSIQLFMELYTSDEYE